jgi:hypothetical protein
MKKKPIFCRRLQKVFKCSFSCLIPVTNLKVEQIMIVKSAVLGAFDWCDRSVSKVIS